MIYMVELDFPHPDRQAEWDAWYSKHLATLLSVPGFRSAQRFRATHQTRSPYLAMYGIASAAVLDSPAYRAVGGPDSVGQWKPLMTNWVRNLLEGLDEAPDVPLDGHLIVVDCTAHSGGRLPATWARLRPVGLDRTITERGILVCGPGDPVPSIAGDESLSLRIFKPLTPRLSA